jgi:hypothetical protein
LVQILLFTAKKFEKRGPKFLFMGKNGKKIWGVEGGSIGGKRNLE